MSIDRKNLVINMQCLKYRTGSGFKHLQEFLIVCTGFSIMLFVNCILPGLCKSPNFNWEVDDKKNPNCKITTCKLCWNYIAKLLQNVMKKVCMCKHFQYINAQISKKHPPKKNPESLVKIDVTSKNIYLKIPFIFLSVNIKIVSYRETNKNLFDSILL